MFLTKYNKNVKMFSKNELKKKECFWMKKQYLAPMFVVFNVSCGMQITTSPFSDNLYDNTDNDKFGAFFDL